MKVFFIFFVFLISFSITESKPKEIVVTHEIDAVTVYLNSAEITRKTKITIPKGKSDIVFEGISSKILKQGLKVHFSNNVKVYTVNIEKNKNYVINSDPYRTISSVMEKSIEEKTNIQVELKTLLKELKFLEKNMRIGGGNKVSFDELDTAAKYFSEKVKAIHLKVNQQEKELKKNEDFIKHLKNEQIKVEKRLEKTNTNIRITIISEIETTSNINLRYLVSNAVWKPYYSIRTKGIDEDIAFEYQAQIYNDTGNDWNNKPLTLALIDPSDDVSKPKMNTWVLTNDGYGRRDYTAEGRLSKAKGNYNRSNNDEEIVYDEIHVDDLSTRFNITDLHFIPSDATPHLIDVKTYVKKATYYTLAIPKIKDGAFIIARIPDWENMGLIDGPINLYYNNTYQGVSQLDTQQVENSLDISLGKDNSYTITRRKLSNKSIKRLIGLNINEELTYEFIIKNNRNKKMEIELRDQLPVSVDKNVEVKVINISNAEIDTQSGQLTWKLKLNPNERKKVILKFNVKYPKKMRGIFKINRKNLKSPRFF